jgi:hypothetical protein
LPPVLGLPVGISGPVPCSELVLAWLSDHMYALGCLFRISASRCVGTPLCSALQPGEFQTRLTFPAVKEMFLQIVR